MPIATLFGYIFILMCNDKNRYIIDVVLQYQSRLNRAKDSAPTVLAVGSVGL
uniref:Uncharacterized protein n=1 Tax=Anguilla anguilla TaxID=7936 RepID=A0A0E9WP00_ANGAN